MTRRRGRGPLWLGVGLALVALAWVHLEQWVSRRLRAALDPRGLGACRVGGIDWMPPTSVALRDVQLSLPGLLLIAPRVELRTNWHPWIGEVLPVRRIRIDRPVIAIDGVPHVPSSPSDSAERVQGLSSLGFLMSRHSSDGLRIESVTVVDGRIELIDRSQTPPFRARINHVFAAAGPFKSGSAAQDPISIAVKGEIQQSTTEPAAARCAGWVAWSLRNLELSCDAGPLLVAAIEPYYQGQVRLRAYDATAQVSGRATAVANRLDATLRLEISNLSQADLSYLGRTIMDIKRLAAEHERFLTGQIHASGRLDQPSAWQVQLMPGNAVVQRILETVLEYGVRQVPIRLAGETVQVGLTASAPPTPPVAPASEIPLMLDPQPGDIVAPASEAEAGSTPPASASQPPATDAAPIAGSDAADPSTTP